MLPGYLVPLMVAGPYVQVAPHLDGIVHIAINGTQRCGATMISPSLALSIASCFLRELPLPVEQQMACLRGNCEGAFVPSSTIRLIGGPDARIGMVVARVTRLAARFTAWWAMSDVCTRAVCGEGWDIALLELNPSCDHGELACTLPLQLASAPLSTGTTLLAVGYGDYPEYDQRSEWDLQLSSSGGSVRRAIETRVWQVASRQLLHTDLPARAVMTSSGTVGRVGAFCNADLGAALVSNRSGVWEIDGLHVPSSANELLDGGVGCSAASGVAWSTYVSRCWLEATARAWQRPPISTQHAEACADLDFFPPELASLNLGGGGGVAILPGNCTALGCEQGVCLADGVCVCEPEVYGPRCTASGPPPQPTAAPLSAFVVSPSGHDDSQCGSEAHPCKTLRQALLNQLWQALHAPADAPAAAITLADGVHSGEGNRALILHGGEVQISSSHGPEYTTLDCSRVDNDWGQLFLRGESERVTVRGLTLRKCLVEQQLAAATAQHPQYAVDVAGAFKWPRTRQGASFEANIWLSG